MDQDVSRKRKRTSSNNSALSSKHVTENLHRYGENILHCTVNITRGIKEFGNGIVLKFVCALLNSGGGILHMKNLDAERGVVLSKHLDTWWSGMEIKMAEILSRDDICNYFDLVGNHDDHDLYLFVKTAEHLCSLCYHSRLPTDTATHEVTYQSMLRLLVSHGEPGSLEELPPIPDRFVYGRSAEELKKETKQIQFKLLTTPQKKSKDRSTLPEKIRGMMIRYVSAFANHEGGRIYFGIDDARASVIGEDLNESEQKKTELLVAGRMKTMIWRDSRLSVERGTHWDIHFFPIEKNPRKGHNVVVVVSVCKFPGGVFTNIPDSSYVNTDGKVAEFSFDQWKEAVLNPLRDVPELHSRFLKVSLMVPRAPLVFTLPNTIETIKQKVLLAKQNEVQPRHYIESYVTPPFRESINKVVGCFNGDKSVCLGMECWGLKVPMEMTDDIICDIAIVTEADGIHVLTFTHSNAPHVEQHSQIAANVLKNRLVHIGGCTEKFSVICHVVDLSQQNCADVLEREVGERDVYPSHFCSTARKFNKILNSFAICMGSYRAKSQNMDLLNQNGCYNFVLTHDQFELLWRQQFTKELWVHGPAGAGKTVAAVQMIQELRRRGCSYDNILYLAENDKLCEFVRSHNLCLVTSRRALLIDVNNKDLMENKYGAICNVIVDEVQNFKDRDGDWYSLAEKLANQKPSHFSNHSQRCCNYFWLFMDYSQKVHKFKAGLPSVIGKNNFMLSEVSRSTKEIFDFTSRLMMASENVDGLCSPLMQHVHSTPVLAHNFSSGKGVDILSCKEAEIKMLLSKVMAGLLQNGVHENDIAILVGRRTELGKLQSAMKDIHLSETSPDKEHAGKTKEIVDKDLDLKTSRSIEKHLQECGSSSKIMMVKPGTTERTSSASNDDGGGDRGDVDQDDDDDDVNEGEDDALEISNQFDVLSSSSSGEQIAGDYDTPEDSMNACGDGDRNRNVKFYAQNSMQESEDGNAIEETEVPVVDNSNKTEFKTGVSVDTVRRFSGLDKAAVIGINPRVNEEHADFNKFILSLATRARDNLVIITTSDDVREQLEQFKSPPSKYA